MQRNRFARITYLENIAKQDMTQFAVGDIPGNTSQQKKKNQEIKQKKEDVSTSTNRRIHRS